MLRALLVITYFCNGLLLHCSEAVDPAITFLLQRQEADGHWSDQTHHLLAPALPADEDGSTWSDIATTGLVLRALLTNKCEPLDHPEVLSAIQKGTNYLCKLQQPDGSLSRDHGVHAIATHALGLVNRYGIMPDISPFAEKALKYLIGKQQIACGWPRSDDDREHIDMWASFWCLQACAGKDLRQAKNKLYWNWWDKIAKASIQDNENPAFPASFVISADGSWSLQPSDNNATAAALFISDQLDEQDFELRKELQKRLADSIATDEKIINWPQRVALASRNTREIKRQWAWMESPTTEMVKEGLTVGSWPASGADNGRISATACALIVDHQIALTHVSHNVTLALEFFKQQANGDGGWSDRAADGDAKQSNISTTALALLCYMGAGYDHKTPNRYKRVVEQGIKFLQNTPDFSQLSTEKLALATLTLTEAYAMTNDPELKIVQTHLNLLLSRRTDIPGEKVSASAWGAVSRPTATQHDTWTTLWCVMAMKSGIAGGLNIDDGLEQTEKWLHQMGTVPKQDEEAQFSAHFQWDASGRCQREGRAEAAALLISRFIPGKHDRPFDNALIPIVVAQEAARQKNNKFDVVTAYVTTLSLFHVGWRHWEQIRRARINGLPAFNDDNLLKDAIGPSAALEEPIGNITATAFLTLINEIVMRSMYFEEPHD